MPGICQDTLAVAADTPSTTMFRQNDVAFKRFSSALSACRNLGALTLVHAPPGDIDELVDVYLVVRHLLP